MKTVVWLFLFSVMCPMAQAQSEFSSGSDVPLKALRMTIVDLISSYPGQYDQGPAFLSRLDRIAKRKPGQARDNALEALKREALLSNPLLDFDTLLMVRRLSQGDRGLPANWQGNERLRRTISLVYPVRLSLSLPCQFAGSPRSP